MMNKIGFNFDKYSFFITLLAYAENPRAVHKRISKNISANSALSPIQFASASNSSAASSRRTDSSIASLEFISIDSANLSTFPTRMNFPNCSIDCGIQHESYRRKISKRPRAIRFVVFFVISPLIHPDLNPRYMLSNQLYGWQSRRTQPTASFSVRVFRWRFYQMNF